MNIVGFFVELLLATAGVAGIAVISVLMTLAPIMLISLGWFPDSWWVLVPVFAWWEFEIFALAIGLVSCVWRVVGMGHE